MRDEGGMWNHVQVSSWLEMSFPVITGGPTLGIATIVVVWQVPGCLVVLIHRTSNILITVC